MRRTKIKDGSYKEVCKIMDKSISGTAKADEIARLILGTYGKDMGRIKKGSSGASDGTTASFIDGISRLVENAIAAKLRLRIDKISINIIGDTWEKANVELYFPNGNVNDHHVLAKFLMSTNSPDARGMYLHNSQMKYKIVECGDNVSVDCRQIESK